MEAGHGRKSASLQVLGFTLEELNQRLGERWRLPELTQISQGLHNSFQPQPLTVMLACAVARDSAQSWTAPETRDHLELLAEFLEISLDSAQAQLHQTAALAARKLQGLPLPLPACRLTLAGGHPYSEPTEQTKPNDIRDVRSAETDERGRIEQQAALQSRTHPPDSPLRECLRQLVDEMRGLYGLETVMFAMLSADKQTLSARFVTSRQKEKEFQGFQVDLRQPSLFSALMKKPQSLWLSHDNLHKYQRAIPDRILSLLCAKGCLLMSVFIDQRPIGILYADNGCGSKGLSAAQYNNFKLLCQQFAQQLAEKSAR
jgi:hypothetical protein